VRTRILARGATTELAACTRMMRAFLNAPGWRALEQLPAGRYMLTVTVTDRAGTAGHLTAPCAHADGRAVVSRSAPRWNRASGSGRACIGRECELSEAPRSNEGHHDSRSCSPARYGLQMGHGALPMPVDARRFRRIRRVERRFGPRDRPSWPKRRSLAGDQGLRNRPICSYFPTARPGLEPGTPRFSGSRGGAIPLPEDLQIRGCESVGVWLDGLGSGRFRAGLGLRLGLEVPMSALCATLGYAPRSARQTPRRRSPGKPSDRCNAALRGGLSRKSVGRPRSGSAAGAGQRRSAVASW
jgi:hypothetical protein